MKPSERRVHARRGTAALVAIAMLTATGCGDDDTTVDPPPTGATPAPTAGDPGPNDTSAGPRTVQGTVRLQPGTGCVALETDDGVLDLLFDGYSRRDTDTTVELVADDDGRVLARDGDTLVVSGFPGAAPAGACGNPFAVDSLNSVIPAG